MKPNKIFSVHAKNSITNVLVYNKRHYFDVSKASVSRLAEVMHIYNLTVNTTIYNGVHFLIERAV